MPPPPRRRRRRTRGLAVFHKSDDNDNNNGRPPSPSPNRTTHSSSYLTLGRLTLQTVLHLNVELFYLQRAIEKVVLFVHPPGRFFQNRRRVHAGLCKKKNYKTPFVITIVGEGARLDYNRGIIGGRRILTDCQVGGQRYFVRTKRPHPEVVHPDHAVDAHESLQHVDEIHTFGHAFHQHDHGIPQDVECGDQHQNGEQERANGIDYLPIGLKNKLELFNNAKRAQKGVDREILF